MARQPEKIIVDNETYIVGLMDPKTALRILTRLTKLLGEPLVAFLSNVDPADPKKSILDSQISPDVIANALRGLVGRLDEDMVIETAEQLCTVVLYKGKPVQFDTHFMGRIGHMVKVIGKVLKVQYSDFFGVFPALAVSKDSQDSTQDLSI